MVKEQNRIMLFPILKMTVLRNDKHKEKTHKKTQNIVCYQQTRIMHDAHDKTLINLMKLHTIFKKKT